MEKGCQYVAPIDFGGITFQKVASFVCLPGGLGVVVALVANPETNLRNVRRRRERWRCLAVLAVRGGSGEVSGNESCVWCRHLNALTTFKWNRPDRGNSSVDDKEGSGSSSDFGLL